MLPGSVELNQSYRVISLQSGMKAELPTECVVALGNFDGVHLAHKAILSATVKEARKKNIASAVFLFEKDPDESNAGIVRHITTLEEKTAEIKELGMQYAVLADFSAFRSLTPTQFELFLKQDCHAVSCFCGENFHYGIHASADADCLKQCSLFSTVIVPMQYLNGEIISATAIRDALEEGDLFKANAMLGRPFSLSGLVEKGKRLGNTIGFPTANLSFPPLSVIPKHGVYKTVTVLNGKEYPSVTNIGLRPTVENAEKVNAETHILRFGEDLYGKEITVRFLSFLRPEIKFQSLHELQTQIEKDIQAVLQ